MPSFLPKRIRGDAARIVFVFFTILYQVKTLLSLVRIERKSPITRELRKVFS